MWHKLSLNDILFENRRQRYSFDGKAGSMGGEVTKALFKYCPTIKCGRAAVDGEQITDLEIKIGTGYTVIGANREEETIGTEPTNTQDARVEIGFEGKKITLGSFRPDGYAGLSIKPNTRNSEYIRVQSRLLDMDLWYDVPPFGNQSAENNLPVTKVLEQFNNIKPLIRLSPGSEEDAREQIRRQNRNRAPFFENPIALENFVQEQIDNLNSRFTEINWALDRSVLSLLAKVTVTGPRRNPVWSGENVLEAQSSARLFWVEFYPNKNIPDIVKTLEEQKIICRPSKLWKEAKPKNPDGSIAPVPQDLDDNKWVMAGSARLEDEWTLATIQLRYARRDRRGGSLSPANQAAIWNAIGDDYFVFLDIQRGEHLAHLVRTPTAPIQAIGHWDMMAFANGNIPDSGSFTVETNPQTNKLKIRSIPALQTKEIPLLDSTYFKGDKNWVLSEFTDRLAVGLAYNDIDWAQAEKYPFNEEMLELIRPYERGEELI